MRKFKKHKPPKSLQPNAKPKANSSKSLAETAIIKETPKPKPIPFINYATYIKSKEWFAWRKFMFDWRGKKCQLCMRDDKPLHLHHMTYKRLGKEDPRDVLVVCVTCHDFIHKQHEHWK